MSGESFDDFEAPPVNDNWQPASDGEADWALRKIAEARSRVAHHEAERAKAIEKWDRYVEQASREALQTETFFAAKLHGYLLSLREAGKLGKKKSYDLPSGRLQLRHIDARWEPGDKDAVKAYAEACDYMQVRVEPDLTKLRELCAEGVDVPGMVLARQSGETFRIVLDTEQKAGA